VKKGDVILVSFPFTDLSGSKLRPAFVLAESNQDVLVAFITTQSKWSDEFSIKLTATAINGLKIDSLVRLNKITTLDKNLVFGKLGNLSEMDINQINVGLIKLLNLYNP
jgi:mRNA interferase MazF